ADVAVVAVEVGAVVVGVDVGVLVGVVVGLVVGEVVGVGVQVGLAVGVGVGGQVGEGGDQRAGAMTGGPAGAVPVEADACGLPGVFDAAAECEAALDGALARSPASDAL